LEKNFLCLIHLGEEEVPHLWANLTYLQESFKDIECVLIVDSAKFFDRAKNLGVNSHFYTRDNSVTELFGRAEGKFDYEFRNGFWRYSLERLFAFVQFHSTISSPLLHIESDILLLNNFPWNRIYLLEKMGWQSLGPESDVASIVFSPSAENSAIFRDRIFSLIEEDLSLTDMTVLAKLRRTFRSEYLTIPSAPTTDTKVFNQYSSDEKDRISELTHFFGGYFDSAPLGMWNIGQDPRNRYGFSVRFKEMPESILDPSRIQIQIDRGGSRLIDQFGNSIYSLHIHSKDVDLFDLTNIEIIRPYLFGGTRRKRYTFYRTMFVRLILDYKRRGKLLELFANLPIFNRLNRFETFLKIKKVLKKITLPSQN
jgi:hypothetical protein